MWLVAGALVVTCLGVSRAPARYRLALTTEATQVFSHGRFPSMTDVVMNSIGAGLGAMGSAGRRPPSRGGS